MKINQAIKILFQLTETEAIHCHPDNVKAIKLGMEALNRLKTMRHDNITDAVFYLPGETKE